MPLCVDVPLRRLLSVMRAIVGRGAARTQAVALIASASLPVPAVHAQSPVTLASPDRRNVVTVAVRNGRLTYALARDGRAIILPSRLGFALRGAAPLDSGLRLVDTQRSTVDTTWTQPWGEVKRVRDRHHELRVRVAET